MVFIQESMCALYSVCLLVICMHAGTCVCVCVGGGGVELCMLRFGQRERKEFLVRRDHKTNRWMFGELIMGFSNKPPPVMLRAKTY
jgi:hypothetical protein